MIFSRAIGAVVVSTFFSYASFGYVSFATGSCTSQGIWTKTALQNLNNIRNAVNSLMNDPDCKGIENFYNPGTMNATTSIDELSDGGSSSSADRNEALPGEISVLRDYVTSKGPNSQVVSQVLGQKAIEQIVTKTSNVSGIMQTGNGSIASTIFDPNDRIARTATVGFETINGLLDQLPRFQRCLQKNGQQGRILLSAVVRVASALVSSGGAVTSKFAETMNKFVSFWRSQNYYGIMSKLDSKEFENSMSCMVEATAEAYCSVKDAYSILDFGAQQNQVNSKVSQLEKESTNPLQGYYILVRELPIISKWIQKLQEGVVPKMIDQAIAQGKTFDVMNNLLKKRSMLKAIYSDKVNFYYNLDSRDPIQGMDRKKNYIVSTILDSIVNEILSGDSAVFFKTAVSEEKLPFYLIGVDTFPAGYTPINYNVSPDSANFYAGGPSTSWSTFMSSRGQQGRFITQFSDPDALVKVIDSRLGALIQNAQEIGSQYFRQRISMDLPNLVAESLTDPTITVLEALQNIRGYLRSLYARFRGVNNLIDQAQIPVLIDTISKVERVLAAYKPLGDLSAEVLAEFDRRISDGSDLNVDPAFSDRIKTSYENVVETVFKDFDVVLQHESFLSNRLGNLISHDYALRIRSHEDMTPFQKDLLLVTGNTLFERMSSLFAGFGVPSKLDLDTAQYTNLVSLQATEELFFKDYLDAIVNANRYTGGLVSNSFAKKIVTWTRYSNNTKTKDTTEGSVAGVKARLCIQTLGFSRFDYFEPFCHGAILQSVFDNKNKLSSLSLRYDDLFNERRRFAMYNRGQDSHICTLRNFIRENYVHSLTVSSGLDSTKQQSENDTNPSRSYPPIPLAPIEPPSTIPIKVINIEPFSIDHF